MSPRRRLSTRLIQSAALILAGVVLLSSLLDPRPAAMVTDPLDALQPERARLAHFASHARHAVLPGSSFTVDAATARERLELWRTMLAFSSRRTPVPPWDAAASNARYVVAGGSHRPKEPELRLVVGFPGGTVWERR